MNHQQQNARMLDLGCGDGATEIVYFPIHAFLESGSGIDISLKRALPVQKKRKFPMLFFLFMMVKTFRLKTIVLIYCL